MADCVQGRDGDPESGRRRDPVERAGCHRPARLAQCRNRQGLVGYAYPDIDPGPADRIQAALAQRTRPGRPGAVVRPAGGPRPALPPRPRTRARPPRAAEPWRPSRCPDVAGRRPGRRSPDPPRMARTAGRRRTAWRPSGRTPSAWSTPQTECSGSADSGPAWSSSITRTCREPRQHQAQRAGPGGGDGGAGRVVGAGGDHDRAGTGAERRRQPRRRRALVVHRHRDRHQTQGGDQVQQVGPARILDRDPVARPQVRAEQALDRVQRTAGDADHPGCDTIARERVPRPASARSPGSGSHAPPRPDPAATAGPACRWTDRRHPPERRAATDHARPAPAAGAGPGCRCAPASRSRPGLATPGRQQPPSPG